MSQMQEDEQEEAKKPDKKRLWRWLYWFTAIGTSLTALFMVSVWTAWNYHGDWWQTFLFVLLGGAFYSALCFWPGKARLAGIVGTLLWSVIAWFVGYAYVVSNVLNTSHMAPVLYQSELIFMASVPLVMLFLVFILLVNRQDIVGN